MNDLEMWTKYCEERNIDKSLKYGAWKFGGNPNKLKDLVIKGIKTATSSAYDLYLLDNEPIPKEGDYSVILDNDGKASCIIRTTKVYVKRFCDVTKEHAFKEGERNRTLEDWKDIYREFFLNEYKGYFILFTENSNILCEESELVYVPNKK